MPPLLLRGISRRFQRLSPCDGQVAHVLRTLLPVAASSIATTALPLDLHVLSLPLAFILSQDQTLLCIFLYFQAVPDALQFLKESTLSIYLLVLGTCFLYFLPVFSMIFSCPAPGDPSRSQPLLTALVPNGIAKVLLFSLPPNFSRTFFHLFLQKFRRLNPLYRIKRH